MHAKDRKLCSGLLITDGVRVLLLMRSPEVNDPNLWGIPGGHVSVGEDPMDSAIRESMEEMGGLPNGKPVGKYQIGQYQTYIWRVGPQDLESFIPVLNWEHTGHGIFQIGDIRSDLSVHPGVRKVVNLHWGID